MTIAFDATSVIGSGGGNFRGSWTHTPVGVPKGVFVCVNYDNTGLQRVTGVSYGGQALSLAAYIDQDSGAQSNSQIWFRGTTLPTGPQTVVVSGTNDQAGISSAVTVTALGNTALEGSAATGNGTGATASGTPATNGKTCLGVACAQGSGGGGFSVVAAMAAAYVAHARGYHAYQAPPSASAVPIGFTFLGGGAKSWAAVHAADTTPDPIGRSFAVIG